MASISSLMSSSSSSSIYGSRNSNIISGLASGMDTESMIEGMVQGYQQKIAQLGQNRTKLQWQQSAYQSISDKLVEFSRKYTSYTNPTTNLFSSSFFSNAILTSTKGTYADLITATGKSSSDISINAVKQLATAARYSTGASLDASITEANGKVTVSGQSVNLGERQKTSAMSGTLELKYSTSTISLDFDESELFNKDDGTLDTAKFKDAVVEKLKEQTVTVNGKQYTADELINFDIGSDGKVTLTDKLNEGSITHFTGASGDFAGFVTNADSAKDTDSFTLDTTKQVYDESATKAEYLSGKQFTFTFNGQSKTVTLGEIAGDDSDPGATVEKMLQNELDKAFGQGKVTVGMTADSAGNSTFSFTVDKGDQFSMTSTASDVLGMGKQGASTYLNTSKTLGELLGSTDDGGLNGLTGDWAKAVGSVTEQKDSSGKITYVDEDGNTVDKDGYRLDKDGKRFMEYELTINDVSIGKFSKDTALETVMNSINSSTEAGVKVSYSKLTNQFVFEAKNTGEGGRIDIGGGLGQTLFGDSSGYQKGTDAEISVTVNGQETTLKRSSNTFDLDGMSVTLNGTFEVDASKNETAVTFSSKTDADKIIDVVKTMVEDYNAIMSEVKKAYSDTPLKTTSGGRYEPLTDEDRADMSESEIKAYEEKAKTGILFMDRDLSSLYNALRSAITPGGADGSLLRSIGINTSYEDGLTTISLDESALRSALEENPDRVKDAFTKSKDGGSTSDGLMASIQKVTDRYAATTGSVKGILIEKAGSKYSPAAALDNTLLDKMTDIDDQITKWQTKMSDKVDYYTNKFTQLEMLISQMNSQSSTLAGLMGG